MCDRGCPCYTPDRQLIITDITNDPNILPPELQVMLMVYLNTKDFVSYTSTCRALYCIALDPSYRSHFSHRREKKKFIPYTEKLEVRFEKVIAAFDTAIDDVDLYAHPQHTCYNEAANGTRIHDMPKHKTFPCTSVARAAVARIKYNEGVGRAKELIHNALNIDSNRLQQAGRKRLDQRRGKDKKRRASEAFRVRTKANHQRKAKRAKHELRVSKRRNDYYHAASKAKARKISSDLPSKRVCSPLSPAAHLVANGPIVSLHQRQRGCPHWSQMGHRQRR